ncbi:MAG: DNA translocase FtsK 4TM domain-containing protein, partial [Alistipes sp.]|nr:DNA translocase FtsK 4TM domain-containing protein [Alistipes sp.]
MAVKDKNTEAAPSDGKRTGKENIRWGIGLTLLAAGFYALMSILFYYATWKADYAILHPGLSDYEGGRTISNACGTYGAYIADAIVGQSFGVFGILVPVMTMLIGVRIIRRRPRFINRLLLCCMLVLIFGSLTLGLAFGDKWGVFHSGWGGGFGVFVMREIGKVIGPVGNIIFLVVGWIFTGVLINTNFINTVNTAGTAVVDGGEAIWDSVSHSMPRFFRRRKKEQNFDEFLRESEELRPEGPESEEEFFDDEPELPEEEQEPIVEGPQLPEEDSEEEIAGPEEPEESEEPEGDSEAEEDAPRQSGLGQIVVEEHREQQVGEHEIGTLYDPMKDLHNYHRPSPELLEEHSSDSHVTDEEITYNKHRIEETLANFGIPIRDMKATVGPTVTLYEIVQEQGVKIAKIRGLENDIAQSLKALGIRIIAPIPGRGTIGIEVPNRDKEIVSMRSAVLSKRFQQFEAELPIVIGRTIQNENYVFDLAKMPHLLVAGATGQGKSVGLNAIITSLLYRKHPAQLKFVLIDPKMVEFSLYARLEKHFLAKMESEEDAIITDPKKAVNTLQALCIEMGNRLELCKKAAAKNIVEYNEKFVNRRLNPANGHAYMPYIVVVIDEFADLIMMAKEVEAPV